MSSFPYLGEIIMFAGNFAPQGFAMCDGQLLAISQNDALFSLIGTTYGGDGQVTFALPDLRGRLPVHQGTGAGGSYFTGELGGEEQVTLAVGAMPAHTHIARGGAVGNQISPANAYWSTDPSANTAAYSTAVPSVSMASDAVTPGGGNQPHDNMQPCLGINFCIALTGIFPSQN